MQGSFNSILKDIYILCVCIMITIVVVKSGSLDSFLEQIAHLPVVGSFIAGIFFTSVFTIAASGVILVKISQVTDPFTVAFIGACGALLGDLALFSFVRDKITKNVDSLVQKASRGYPFAIFHLEFLRWLNPILGALVIASPLPDELGLALLGFSKLKPQTLAAILFFMNGLGIYILASIAHIG